MFRLITLLGLRLDGQTASSLSPKAPGEKQMTTDRTFPEGWDETRIRRILDHYESQTEDEAMAEDQQAWEDKAGTFIEIPNDLLPAVRQLLAIKST